MRGPKLAAVLFFVAAALALLAFVGEYIRRDTISWGLLAAGVFLAAMGEAQRRRISRA